MSDSRSRTYVVRGREFRSPREICAHFGVSRDYVRKCIRDKTMDKIGVGKGRNSPRKIPVEIDGVKYPSIADAARGIGVTHKKLSLIIDLVGRRL